MLAQFFLGFGNPAGCLDAETLGAQPIRHGLEKPSIIVNDEEVRIFGGCFHTKPSQAWGILWIKADIQPPRNRRLQKSHGLASRRFRDSPQLTFPSTPTDFMA